MKLNLHRFWTTPSEKNSQKFLSNMEKAWKSESNFLKSEQEFIENFTKIFRNIQGVRF